MNCNDRQFLGLDQATKMALSRRTFIKGSAGGIGLAALGSLMGTPGFAANPGLGFPNFKPKAKRIIYLFQSGAPSQMERNTKPLNAEVGGSLNPTWVEWLMGWPLGWTDCAASATDKCQAWCASHGVFFQRADTKWAA